MKAGNANTVDDLENPSLRHRVASKGSATTTAITTRRRIERKLRPKRRKKRKEGKVVRLAIFLLLVGTALLVLYIITDNNSSNIEKTQEMTPLAMNTSSAIITPSTQVTHILHTRFMQFQSHLPHLSTSRYLLFKTVCFSTVSAQTTSNFLWIIRTDPNLDDVVKQQMVDLLKPYPNFYLVGSNQNFMAEESSGGWRGGIIGHDLLELEAQGLIYTGDMSLLHHAVKNELNRIVLETRLDADDGFHQSYMEYIQSRALELFLPSSSSSSNGLSEKEEGEEQLTTTPQRKWMYWCVQTNFEWHLSSHNDKSHQHQHHHHPGTIRIDTHSKYCVTPGLTIGYAPYTNIENVPSYSHDVLIKELLKQNHNCGSSGVSASKYSGGDCYELVSQIFALRSRSATSAGMMDVDEKGTSTEYWSKITTYFSIRKSSFQEANDFMSQHVVQIAQDNMKGQCTIGHSCKVSSKEKLQRFVDVELEQSQLVNIGFD
uniref:Uncharacterized protein n=1 Tax=Ditylum brightwellii TaxID=49249 RepID=A0A7S4QDQ1_9STRA